MHGRVLSRVLLNSREKLVCNRQLREAKLLRSMLFSSRSLRNRTRIWVLIGVCAAALLGTVQWLRLRAHDPVVAALKMRSAILARDAEGLYAFRTVNEESETGLSLGTFKKVCEEIVWPSLDAVQTTDRVVTDRLNHPATAGIASIELILPDGSPFSWGVQAHVTETTPKAPVLCYLLIQSWALDYAVMHPEEYKRGLNFGKAKLHGLARHQRRLEELGIRGMISQGGVTQTWEQVRAQWTSDAEQFVARR